ncbi:hypothetical protein MXD63_08660 [Frankia sp. Cpl3]|nr:hypothetical protein [Frankia sp. Cpl3]
MAGLNGEGEGEEDVPYFAGVGTLLRLIHELSTRTRRAAPLPAICLIRASGDGPWLKRLRFRLRQGRGNRRIPHVLVPSDAAAGTTASDQASRVESFVSAIFKELCIDGFGVTVIRFRHFTLAQRLTKLELAGSDEPVDRILKNELRKWAGFRDPREQNQIIDSTPGIARALLYLLVLATPEIRLRLWMRGLIPGFGQPRWLLRQQRHLPDMRADSFIGFAQRICANQDNNDSKRHQIDWLLLNAFLQDLRLAYRRRPWRIRAWRRTANILVLLENVTVDNGGVDLVTLLGDVRNATGENDPLVVVASSSEDEATRITAAWAIDEDSDRAVGPRLGNWQLPRPAADADDAYEVWAALPTPGPRPVESWWLPLRIPLSGRRPPVPPQPALPLAATGWRRAMPPPPWPLGARRWVLWSLTLVLLMLAGTVAWIATPGLRHGCWSTTDGVSVSWIDGECVGLTGGPFAFEDLDGDARSGDQLRAVQAAIFRQNECANILRRQATITRDFVTLVYFAALSASSEAQANWSAAQVGELQGVLTLQRHQNAVPNAKDPACRPSTDEISSGTEQSGPVVRVVIANGGSDMRFADRVAKKHLIPFAGRPDEKVVGVIGMDRSVRETREAITDLGKARIPVIATTLSSDGLADLSPYYLQIVPQNRRQALLVRMYAIRTQRMKVTVHYPKGSCGNDDGVLPDIDDHYVYTLVRDLQDEFPATSTGSSDGARAPELNLRGWDPPSCRSGALKSWFQEECGSMDARDLIFYAGRHEDFKDFVAGMKSCLDTVQGSSMNGSLVLADDSVTRYVIENAGASSQNVIFRYVSKGAVAVLARKDCSDGVLEEKRRVGTVALVFGDELPQFCNRLRSMYTLTGIEEPQAYGADERVALAYDAAKMMVDAVDATGETDILVIMRELRSKEYSGVTGTVDFRATQVADSKQLVVMRIDLGRKTLPDGDNPTTRQPGTDVEYDTFVTCKYVIRGMPPSGTDCWNNSLGPLAPPPVAVGTPDGHE